MRKNIDLRSLVGRDVLDQGTRPTCVAFAASVANEALHHAEKTAEHFAPEALWWQATTAGATSLRGMVLNNVAPALLGYGQPELSQWPYDPTLGAGTEEPPENLQNPPWKRSALNDVVLKHDGIEDALEDELEHSHPVILIVEVTDEFGQPDDEGIVAMPNMRAASGSYHAVACVGAAYHPTRGRLLLIKNSWGTDWGLGGYCWLPLEYLTAFVVQAAAIVDI
ncbi:MULTISPECIES: C1 family peptidase [Micrococcaceae]|uniref:C1 family peptidase n=1 Tax=Micrococcaceae TaxID=1268 RepID=UPI0009E6BE55|nr:C1 family peptidase [Arthrobacter sp. Leaf141]